MIAMLVGLACTKPVPPTPAAPPTHEEVRFAGPAFTLEGTLHLPPGDGRVPAVVLVHGSGPQSRDEKSPGQLGMTFGFAVPVFAELADGLAERGIAVLRYDKRTCFAMNGCSNAYPGPQLNVTVDDFAADAAAALGFLRDHPRVDPARLVVLGHSQGGSFVPELVRDEELAGGVMLAAPHGELADLLQAQADTVERLLRESGEGDASVRAKVAPLAAMANGVRQIDADPASIPALAGIAPEFWTSWIQVQRRARSVAPGLDAPLLVLSGSEDRNVPPTETEGWRATLAGTDAQVVVLDCVTHAMNCWDGEMPGRHVDARVVQTIAEFVGAR
ncbi:MAG: alpha/beta fold hydrolase [Alphaproteobacteria bacterium]|nr:alpha/beta fold hydrolase [Alphaproteobacteria bacterium]